MQSSNQPGKISLPFAASGQKQTIPVASQVGVEDGRASYTDGFPPLTRTPLAAGGVPPFGTDMNGIMYAVTAIQQWQSAGGLFRFDAVFAASIGGYPAGALLSKSSGSGCWQSTIENNTNDPDAGGAGWKSIEGGGLIGRRVFTASGTYTPSPGMRYCVVTAQGGGGAGSGSAVPTAGTVSLGAGGACGAYSVGTFTATDIGASKAVTIGAGGTAASGAAGGNGAQTSLGALITAPGGPGGPVFNSAPVPAANGNGLTSSAPTGGNLYSSRGANNSQLALGLSSTICYSGAGGSSIFGSGGPSVQSGVAGAMGIGYGSGGSGSATLVSGAALAGGNGASGILIIDEYF